MMTFEIAFDKLIEREGGYVSAEKAAADGDRGGETKYGISKRAYPGVDIQSLTLERAQQIYRRDYWGPAGCDAVPSEVKYPLFDYAVIGGVKSAIKALQCAVGEVPDGIIGPRTLMAVRNTHPLRIALRLQAAMLEQMSNVPSWPTHGRGWVRRVVRNMLEV